MKPVELIKPGNYKIKRLLLITENSVISLKEVFIQLNIYEDLFSFTYSGNLIITETDNLTGKEKILGGERLIIDFESMTEIDNELISLDISLTAIVTKISSETPVTAGMAKQYVIDFVSIDHISNLKTKISKSFVKKPLHEIVEYAISILDSDSKTNIEPTKTILEKVVIPNWNPFKTISWCAEKSVQTRSRVGSSLSTFIFYQTLYNTDDFRQRDVTSYFHYVSIDSLLAKPPKKEVLFNIKETHDYKKDIRKFVMAEAFEVIETFDYLKSSLDGAYNSRLTEISFKKKTWSVKDFNYEKNFNLMDHIHPNPFMNSLNDIVKYSKVPQILFLKSMDENNFNFSKNIRNCQLSFLNNRKIKLLLPGNAFLSVGDIINFKMPSLEKDYTKDNTGLDPTFSGNYIITSINHNISGESYRIAVEAVMESLQT